MDLTEDAFLALARSSPWRWRTLHFTHRNAHRAVEAWLRRPGELLVRTQDGTEHRVGGLPYTRSTITVFLPSAGPDADSSAPQPPPVSRLPHEVVPELRPDGLVAVRPDRWLVDYDDPMWDNYTWVAMLDPVELSHHVAVADLRADEVHGRPVWRANLQALEGYDARCGGNCCELLWSDVSRRCEFADPDDAPAMQPGTVYPDSFEVALDVQTGIVVQLEPVGGNRDGLGFEVTIHEVDADLDADFDHLFPDA